MGKTVGLSARCGIILAAGEGKRLRPLIYRLRGDTLPKQYMNFTGRFSMLEQTFHRAERLSRKERIFAVISQNHLKYREVVAQLSSRPENTVVLQPENKETAPGLLLPLMYLQKYWPESTVAVFPSDHFIVEEDLFMKHVEEAYAWVEDDPSRLVILGVEPRGPEPDYGYIVPRLATPRSFSACALEVSRFIEKPEPLLARKLVLEGGLWNTMVFAARTSCLLERIQRIIPSLFRPFQRIGQAIGTPAEMEVIKEVYKEIETVNFSSRVLQALSIEEPHSLWVLPVKGVTWNDWGTEARIRTSLQLNWIGRDAPVCERSSLN